MIRLIDVTVNKHADRIEALLKTLPETPGVYQYFDEKGDILYVGKAKNIKKRVSSYFRQDQLLSPKIRMLVKKIYDIRYIIVNSEFDALLLENNLIKKLQPRYNSMLKDDKTYPWVCITNEPFPRIFQTRKRISNGSIYFGPYPSLRVLKELQELIRKVFRYRTCNLNLTKESISKHKFQSCICYQIKRCNAPCIGNETQSDYRKTVLQLEKVLRGDFADMVQTLKSEMMLHAGQLEFEKAQEVKEKIMLLEQYKSRSMVVSTNIKDIDVYSIISDEKSAYVNMMRIKNGGIIYSYNTEIQKKLDENDEEMLTLAVHELHEKVESTANEIIVPFKLQLPESYLKQTIPLKGDKKKLLELSERNSKFYRLEKQKQSLLADPERHSKRLLQTLMKDLKMQVLPERIECFDNSNTQGNYPVASMVCFINGKPAKKEYRHFNIKTVVGPNDFASMEEIIYRRYKRMLEEDKPLPQLIVIDGGKGQLSSAVKSLMKLGILGRVNIISIAKRLEEIYLPGDSIPLYLDKKSESLKIIQQLRDEAHRFGITHHRKRRSKGTIFTTLTDIKGIGETTARDLLLKFSSVKNIKRASLEELEECIGKAKAQTVYDFFAAEKEAGD